MQGECREYPLFPSQKRILKNINPPHHWNISYMLFLKSRYNASVLKKVLDDIVGRHEVFKLRFIKKGNNFVQQFDPARTNNYIFIETEVTESNNQEKIIHDIMESVQESINIFDGPLLSVGLIKTGMGDHLYVVVHHLISDAYSFKLLIYDLIYGYMELLKNNKKYTPPKTDSFIEAIENLYAYSNGKLIDEEVKYWKKVLGTKSKELPMDNKITREQKTEIYNSNINEALLDEKKYEELKNILKKFKISEYEFYLSILGLSICDWKKDTTAFVKLAYHGRSNFNGRLNLHRTLGPFWVTYPVVLDTVNRDNTIERVRVIKDMLENIPGKGRGYEVLKEILLENDREFIELDTTVPNILFNYYGKMNEKTLIDPEFGNLSPYFQDFNRHKKAHCDFTLIFNLREIDNCLRLQLIYNKIEFSDDNMNVLFNCFQNNLYISINELKNKYLDLTQIVLKTPG